jgi:hypothetical protein
MFTVAVINEAMIEFMMYGELHSFHNLRIDHAMSQDILTDKRHIKCEIQKESSGSTSIVF